MAFCSTMMVVMPARLDLGDDPLDLLDDHRGKALIGLVEQQELQVAGQRAGDRQHLLLAARERRGFLPAALGQTREMLVDALERPADGLGDLGQDQILLDGQPADDAPVLRHQLEAGLGRLVRLHRVQRLAGEPDLAALHRRRVGAGDRAAASRSCRRRCGRAVPEPRLPSPRRKRPERCSSRRNRHGCRGRRNRPARGGGAGRRGRPATASMVAVIGGRLRDRLPAPSGRRAPLPAGRRR